MVEHKTATMQSATDVLLMSRLWTIRVIQPIVPRNKRNVRLPSISLMNGISSLKKACPKNMVFSEKKMREAIVPMIGEFARSWFM